MSSNSAHEGEQGEIFDHGVQGLRMIKKKKNLDYSIYDEACFLNLILSKNVVYSPE